MAVEKETVNFDATLVLSGFTSGAFFMERYRIEKLLGTGAMGKVFQATDLIENREVALKVLHPNMAKKEQVLQRFRREADILRELGHPGIVRIHASGQAPNGMDYLVMELLEGETLEDRLRRDGPMSPEHFLPLLVQVCDALAAAHLQSVVHRDLKPENLFLLSDGATVKVVDFGLSLAATETRMTKTGIMLGTPRYMAPEQIRSARSADERTDQYALAIIVHEALVGASPFPAEDQAQLLGCVMEGRIQKIEEQQPSIPVALGEVLRRAMSKDRKDRFATIGAFAEAYAESIGMSTGRSRLADGMEDLFAGSIVVEPEVGSAEVELPDPIVPHDAPLHFTRPDSMAEGPPPRAKRKSKRKKRKVNPALIAALFALALVVVVCLSTAAALGMRFWLR